MDQLPKVPGLSAAEQQRLDAELRARGLVTVAAMRLNPQGVAAALRKALGVGVEAIVAAYSAAEAAPAVMEPPAMVAYALDEPEIVEYRPPAPVTTKVTKPAPKKRADKKDGEG